MPSDTDYAHLEREVRNLDREIESRDQVIELLTAANATLQDQLKARIHLPQLLMPILGLLLAAAFGYQVIRSAQVEALITKSEDQLRLMEESAAVISQSSALQGEVASRFVKAMVFSEAASIHNSLKEHLESLHELERAIEQLDLASAIIDEQKERGKSRETLFDVVVPLEGAVSNLFFGVYDRYARVQYELENFGLVEKAGATMVILEPDRWEGYHWVGLGRLEQRNLGAKTVENLMRSLQLKPEKNSDAINLAELHLLNGNVQAAEASAERFQPEPAGPTSRSALAAFYRAYSRFLRGEAEVAEVETAITAWHEATRERAVHLENLEHFANRGIDELVQARRLTEDDAKTAKALAEKFMKSGAR